MTSLARFLRLPAADRNVLLLAGALLLAVRVCLQLLSFRMVRRLALGAAAAGRPKACLPPERIAWAVARAGSRVPGATCLPRALVAESLLRRMGYPATLHIGVTKGDDRTLEAHAWVECLGKVVVGEAGVERYAMLSRAADADAGRAAR
jgi:hypothetical protein